MSKIRSNRGPRFRFFTKGLVGLVILLLAAKSASAYTSAAMTKTNTNAPVGLAPLSARCELGSLNPILNHPARWSAPAKSLNSPSMAASGGFPVVRPVVPHGGTNAIFLGARR